MTSEPGGWRGRHMALAFALGALAGAAAALLLAPRTGAQARRKVRDTVRTARQSMNDLRGSVESAWRRASRAARGVLDDALDSPDTEDRT